ncbi:hypothetical protein LAZ67_1003479 [Cordylochernes scorpioides]|uniref:AAA+ ATPase domain-containing protein n=1 Tax=Cordylochernes scorpioides TaxID=51811 RepID=A0ABY6K1N7_9ARAC|nr:hypothetical protein LAZ67_1003479 [Cordylochernes scorpioides]
METSEALHWTRQQQKIDMDPEQQLYTPKIVDIAAAVIEISPAIVIVYDIDILCPPEELEDEHLPNTLAMRQMFSNIAKILARISRNRNVSLSPEQSAAILENTSGWIPGDLEHLFYAERLSDPRPTADEIVEKSRKIGPVSMDLRKDIVPKVLWSDIGGMEDIKQILRTKIQNLTTSSDIQQAILLYGPPGCSKTLLAMAIATEYRMNFYSISGSDIVSKYLGDTQRNIVNLFKKAQAHRPAVIFFDEFDSLCMKGTFPVILERSVAVWQPFAMELPLSSPAKCELRSVIRFLNAKNNSSVEIHRQLVEVYGEKCMNIKNVRKWCWEFNEGRINVHDEQRSGRPSLPESTVARIDEMVRAIQRITLEEIEDGLNEDCSHFSVHKIVSETLGYRKVSARTPEILTLADQVTTALISEFKKTDGVLFIAATNLPSKLNQGIKLVEFVDAVCW